MVSPGGGERAFISPSPLLSGERIYIPPLLENSPPWGASPGESSPSWERVFIPPSPRWGEGQGEGEIAFAPSSTPFSPGGGEGFWAGLPRRERRFLGWSPGGGEGFAVVSATGEKVLGWSSPRVVSPLPRSQEFLLSPHGKAGKGLGYGRAPISLPREEGVLFLPLSTWGGGGAFFLPLLT